MLLENAERIPQQIVVFVHGHQNGACIVRDDGGQLFIGILAPAIAEQVRADVVVDQLHLHQQFIDARHVTGFGPTDFHSLCPSLLEWNHDSYMYNYTQQS